MAFSYAGSSSGLQWGFTEGKTAWDERVKVPGCQAGVATVPRTFKRTPKSVTEIAAFMHAAQWVAEERAHCAALGRRLACSCR